MTRVLTTNAIESVSHVWPFFTCIHIELDMGNMVRLLLCGEPGKVGGRRFIVSVVFIWRNHQQHHLEAHKIMTSPYVALSMSSLSIKDYTQKCLFITEVEQCMMVWWYIRRNRDIKGYIL